MTLRVLVVDDQALARTGLRMILGSEPEIVVVGEAADGLGAVERALELRPDVVVMDVRMPGLDGIEATRRLIAADPAAKVLVLTTFDLDEYVYEALRAGASGFMRVHAQGRPGGAAHRRGPDDRSRGRFARTINHAATDRAVCAAAGTDSDPAKCGGTAHFS